MPSFVSSIPKKKFRSLVSFRRNLLDTLAIKLSIFSIDDIVYIYQEKKTYFCFSNRTRKNLRLIWWIQLKLRKCSTCHTMLGCLTKTIQWFAKHSNLVLDAENSQILEVATYTFSFNSPFRKTWLTPNYWIFHPREIANEMIKRIVGN